MRKVPVDPSIILSPVCWGFKNIVNIGLRDLFGFARPLHGPRETNFGRACHTTGDTTFKAGATMGQVCFTAISSNRACPTVFIALSSVFQIIVLCALLSGCSMAGVEGQGPFLPAALYQVSCRLLGGRCKAGEMGGGSHAKPPAMGYGC